MSIDKSLRRKSGISRNRSVMTRDERIKMLKETDRWPDGRSPYGLPKVRVLKISTKKVKKEKAAEGEAVPGAAAAADAKPAAGAKPGAKPAAAAAAKPAAKSDAKPGKK